MHSRSRAAVLLSVLTGLTAYSFAQTAWKLTPGAEKKLAAYASADAYQIRPPKGYVAQTQAGGGVVAYAWVSAPRADKTKGWVMVGVGSKPANQKMPDLKTLAKTFAGGVKARRTDWTASEPALGTVNGRNFARIYWKATDEMSRLKMQGFIYVTVDGEKVIQISSQDVQGRSAELGIAEAAALTFKKK